MGRSSTEFFNRELSWLEFNQRVLDEAKNPQIPCLERVKFLAITGSNLDEFFMVRVGGLQMLLEQGSTKPDPAGMSPAQQLQAISQRTHLMTSDQYRCYLEDVEPCLADAGIRRIPFGALSDDQVQMLERVFEEEIFPVVTPVAVDLDAAQTFPLLVNRMLHLFVRLAPETAAPKEEPKPRYAVIPLGNSIRRFVSLPAESGYEYMLLEDVLAMFVDRFFPGQEVLECVPFRITRNADFGVREDLASDLLVQMEKVLDARKESDCVRLEIAERASEQLRGHLQQVLHVNDEDIYALPGPLDLSAFMRLAVLKGFEHLQYEPWSPQPSPQVAPGESIFEVLGRHDLLLSHPYESFDPVVQLLEEAAEDPDVLAIKQILYRTSRTSPIVAALKKAAERGKYVTAIVELKARFDEARNIEWAKDLERAQVQVIYGIKGLKTHAKLCIVVRREPQGIQRYVHFGTGNYNESTARLYADVGWMTCDEDLGRDATSFFNAITGYSQPPLYRKIAAAPISLRDKLLELIESETQRKLQGQKAAIDAKFNSLVDPKIIRALYAASQAGVKIRLNIRGICCLRPGVKGLSENITVVSIVDRFLEHARIMCFHHGGDHLVFISSADWMQRNLDKRIELLVPVEDPKSRDRLIEILELCFKDNLKASKLQANGNYRAVRPTGRRKGVRSQEELYHRACKALGKAEQSRRTVFEPHRAPETRS